MSENAIIIDGQRYDLVTMKRFTFKICKRCDLHDMCDVSKGVNFRKTICNIFGAENNQRFKKSKNK